MFMLHDVADSTRDQYLKSAFAFTKWAMRNGLSNGISLPPPSPRTLVFYAAWRAGQGNSPQYIRSCLSGIAAYFEWHHHRNILRDDHGNIHREISRVLRGISRMLTKAKGERLPLTIPLLHRVLTALPEVFPLMPCHDRHAYECALTNGVYRMLRASEQMAPSPTRYDQVKTALGWDLKLQGATYTFTIKAAKNDPFRISHTVEVYATNTEWCPVATARRWMEHRKAPMDAPLFTLSNNKFMTRTSLSHVIQKCIAHLGLPEKKYKSHSLRGGGAVSMAAAGFGAFVPAAGRWKSDAYLKHLKSVPPSQMAHVMQKMARLATRDVRHQHEQLYQERFTM